MGSKTSLCSAHIAVLWRGVRPWQSNCARLRKAKWDPRWFWIPKSKGPVMEFAIGVGLWWAVSADVTVRAADFVSRSIERPSGVRDASGGHCGGRASVAKAVACSCTLHTWSALLSAIWSHLSLRFLLYTIKIRDILVSQAFKIQAFKFQVIFKTIQPAIWGIQITKEPDNQNCRNLHCRRG